MEYKKNKTVDVKYIDDPKNLTTFLNNVNWDSVIEGAMDVGWGTVQASIAYVFYLGGVAATAAAPGTLGGTAPLAVTSFTVSYWYGMQAAGSVTLGITKIGLGLLGRSAKSNIPPFADLLTPGVPTSVMNLK